MGQWAMSSLRREDGCCLWLHKVYASHAFPSGALIHVGPILTGGQLLDKKSRTEDLRDSFSPPAIGGEMEGSGVAAVAQLAGIACTVIKVRPTEATATWRI